MLNLEQIYELQLKRSYGIDLFWNQVVFMAPIGIGCLPLKASCSSDFCLLRQRAHFQLRKSVLQSLIIMSSKFFELELQDLNCGVSFGPFWHVGLLGLSFPAPNYCVAKSLMRRQTWLPGLMFRFVSKMK